MIEVDEQGAEISVNLGPLREHSVLLKAQFFSISKAKGVNIDEVEVSDAQWVVKGIQLSDLID